MHSILLGVHIKLVVQAGIHPQPHLCALKPALSRAMCLGTCRQEKEISRRERAQAKLLQQQQQTQAPVACEAQQERAALQAPASGTPKANGVRGSSFFGSGRPQAVPNGAASEPRTHYR